jgi:hypothetical protein
VTLRYMLEGLAALHDVALGMRGPGDREDEPQAEDTRHPEMIARAGAGRQFVTNASRRR